MSPHMSEWVTCRLKHIHVLLHIRIEQIQSKTMTPLCHQHSRYIQRYDTLNCDTAEKIDCEKQLWSWQPVFAKIVIKKPKKLIAISLSLALWKFVTISLSFRTLHTLLSWMESLTKQWNNKFKWENVSRENVVNKPLQGHPSELFGTFDQSQTRMVTWLPPSQNWVRTGWPETLININHQGKYFPKSMSVLE